MATEFFRLNAAQTFHSGGHETLAKALKRTSKFIAQIEEDAYASIISVTFDGVDDGTWSSTVVFE